MTTKIKQDKGTITISDDLDKMVRLVLNNLAPNVEKIIKKEMGLIMDNAIDNWLVRSYTNKKGTFVSKLGNGSKHQFNLETKIVSKNGGLGIRGVIKNNAPYAYMIKRGYNSITAQGKESNLSRGDHLWTKLVRDPLAQKADSINEQVIDELAKIQKRA